jgi:spermidine/putrescine-binding protein
MLQSMRKKDTEQFHIRPPRNVINRLNDLSKKFKRDTPNQVAVEILRDYVELWAAAEQTKYDTILRQQDALTRAIKSEALRQPMHDADVEQNKKHETQGKKQIRK